MKMTKKQFLKKLGVRTSNTKSFQVAKAIWKFRKHRCLWHYEVKSYINFSEEKYDVVLRRAARLLGLNYSKNHPILPQVFIVKEGEIITLKHPMVNGFNAGKGEQFLWVNAQGMVVKKKQKIISEIMENRMYYGEYFEKEIKKAKRLKNGKYAIIL